MGTLVRFDKIRANQVRHRNSLVITLVPLSCLVLYKAIGEKMNFERCEMNRLSAASRPISAWISFFVVGEGIFKIA